MAPLKKKKSACAKREKKQGLTVVKTPMSRFRGVTWNKRNSKWLAKISQSGKTKYIGTFLDEVSAARAFDDAARLLRGSNAKVNFPITATERAASDLCSRYQGVSWHKGHNKWRAEIRIDGKKKYIGHYNSQYEAAVVYDEAAREILESSSKDNAESIESALNFPALSQIFSRFGYGCVREEHGLWTVTIRYDNIDTVIGVFKDRRSAKRELNAELKRIRAHQVLQAWNYERMAGLDVPPNPPDVHTSPKTVDEKVGGRCFPASGQRMVLAPMIGPPYVPSGYFVPVGAYAYPSVSGGLFQLGRLAHDMQLGM